MVAKAGSSALADVTIVGATPFDAIGGSLGIADLLGDERPDVVIGAPDANGPSGDGPRTGKVIAVSSELLLR
jgi:hypothetical protein